MTIGVALFLIALGAILRWAVTAQVAGIDLQAAGLILIVIGAVGLVLSLIWTLRGRRSAVVAHPDARDPRVVDPPPPVAVDDPAYRRREPR